MSAALPLCCRRPGADAAAVFADVNTATTSAPRSAAEIRRHARRAAAAQALAQSSSAAGNAHRDSSSARRGGGGARFHTTAGRPHLVSTTPATNSIIAASASRSTSSAAPVAAAAFVVPAPASGQSYSSQRRAHEAARQGHLGSTASAGMAPLSTPACVQAAVRAADDGSVCPGVFSNPIDQCRAAASVVDGGQVEYSSTLATDDLLLLQELSLLECTMRQRALQQAPLTWTEFNGGPLPTDQEQFDAQQANAGRLVIVYQADFDSGTLRLRAPCTLYLGEDVQFNPNAGFTNDWRPTATQRDALQPGGIYSSDAFVLDFFAAIAVESDHVLIDLRGHRLEQHPEHALQQRFCALIELADQPFVPHQGPANFGADIDSGTYVVVCNGTLGRSSHHGLHGNGNEHVLLRDLVAVDYEVAAVALNGPHTAAFLRLQAQGSRRDVPVQATYSASRFLLGLGAVALQNASPPVTPDDVARLNALQDALQTLSNLTVETFDAVINHVGTVPLLYQNPSGVIDGNTYGILLNIYGVAVNSFLETRLAPGDPREARDILFQDVVVQETRGNPVEIIGLYDQATRKYVVDTAGAVFQIARVTDSLDGTYTGNELTNAQIALADLLLHDTALYQSQPTLQGITIPQALVDWAHSTSPALPLTYFVPIVPASPSATSGYSYRHNGDAMAHVQKGVLGIKADGVRRFRLHGVRIEGVRNFGANGQFVPAYGETPHPPSSGLVLYVGGFDGGHPLQGSAEGYTGNVARGLSLASCDTVHLTPTIVRTVRSRTGSAIGVDMFNDTSCVSACGVDVDDVYAATDVPVPSNNYLVGFKAPVAVGVHVGDRAQHVALRDTRVGSLFGAPALDLQSDVVVDSSHDVAVTLSTDV